MAKAKVLLEEHLKALRLPTFLREYDKLAGRVRRPRRGLSPLPAALERVGAARPRTASDLSGASRPPSSPSQRR